MDIRSIKKIDVHAHATMFHDIYPPSKRSRPDSVFVSPEQLIEMYDRLDIEKGFLLPIVSPEAQASVMSSENCKFIADKYPDRFYWFCGVDPRATNDTPSCDLAYLIRHYKALGAKGVGEVTAHIDADDPRVLNLFAACEECDMPVTIHIAPSRDNGYGIYDDLGLPRIEKLLKNFPKLKILGHSQAFWAEISSDVTEETRGRYPTGKVTAGRIEELMDRYPNLYCDLSAGSGHNALMRDEEYAAYFVEKYSDRLLFACDICHAFNDHPFPFRDFLFRMVDEGKISEENYVKMIRGNAIRLFNLED